MLKIWLSVLITFSLTGCNEATVYPNIETLKPVKTIQVDIFLNPEIHGAKFCLRLDPDDGKICGMSAHTLYGWMKQMRKSETYYFDAITQYQNTFVKGQ